VLVVHDLGPELRLVKLNRPEKRNALTRPLIEELARALDEARLDQRVRGLVLAGEGPSFCAGVDLDEFAHGSPESGRALILALKDVCAALRELPKPVACVIQGHCLGGALELAACCDFRVCAPDARLGMPEVWLGIPSVIDAVMLAHHVGVGRARELLLTGESIDAETAYRWGLANRLVPRERLVEAGLELVGQVSRHDPAVVAAQKRLHQQWLELPYTQAVERSVEFLLESFRAGRPQRIATDRLRARADDRQRLQATPQPRHDSGGSDE
jgi:enoyl-CoA hydratase/carnithine racemase